MEKKRKISKKLMFAWPTRSMAISVLAVLVGYITFFATDFMGISPATAGIIFMISKIFDGFTDIAVGYLIDRTHSKLGKGRPYELALVGYCVTIILLFGAPEMGLKASYVYLFVMYTMINSVFLTFLNCNEAVYMANVIDDPSDSVTLASVNGFASMFIALFAGVIIPQLVKTLGTTRSGWLKIALIVAVPCTILGLIRFMLVKEKHQTSKAGESFTVMDMLRSITANKYILLFALMIFASNIGNGLAMNSGTYYAQYIIGDIGAQSILSIGSLGVIFSIVLTPVFSKKFGFIRVIKFTTIIGLAGYLVRLLNPSSVGMVFVSTLFGGLGFTNMFSFYTTFIIDCIDYGEWKTGVRREGVLSCAQSVTAKIGTAIGAGLVGILMSLSGYDGALAVQGASANGMIIGISSVVPAIFCLIQLIILHFYDLDKKLVDIRADLEKRRNNQ